MKRILLIFSLLGGLSMESPAAKPNVVVILSDDLGWGSVGCYGADPSLVSTPRIDSLAREGRRFTDANTPSSVCSPTRYAFLTGRYCWRTSLQSEVLPVNAPLHIETTRLTVASLLKAQGYRTAAIGKWHLGYGSALPCDFTRELKPGPLEIGFDFHFGVPSNHGDASGVYVEDHWVLGLNRESPTSPSPPYVTTGQDGTRRIPLPGAYPLNAPKRVDDAVMDTLTDRAVDWIDRQSADTPFFLYFTPVAVHNPATPSGRTAGKSAGGPFCDFIADLDQSVGRVLDALDRKGFTNNTLVLFTSDNGGVNKPENPKLVQTQAIKAGLKPVGPFRGGKHDIWEGGFRVPFLVRWPGRIPAGSVSEETISLVDTLASLAAITGSPLPGPDTAAEDSHDVSPAWLGEPHASPLRPNLIVHSADGTFAIRQGAHKWIEGIPADDVRPASRKLRAAQFHPQLYDLKADPAETHDLSSNLADRAKDLSALLQRYRDGGYSRQLPPVVTKQKIVIPPLAPLENPQPLDLKEFQGTDWELRKDAWFCRAGEKGAPFSGPLHFRDGVLEFQILLGAADRHSLRIQTSQNAHSFRIVLSRSLLEIAKNPDKGEGPEKTVPLAKTRVTIKPDEWQTIRLTFRGAQLLAETAGISVQATHPVFAEAKEQANFIAFGGEVGIRAARVSGPTEASRSQASPP